MIKGIILDWGGVLTHQGRFEQVIDDFVVKYNADRNETLQKIIDLWRPTRIGEKPSRHFWEELAQHLKADPDEVRTHFTSLFEFNEEMHELVKKLKRHYKLGLLSNNIEDWLEEEIEKYEFRSLFDVIVGSYHAKLKKPDEAIYRYIVEKLDFAPKECVFIDDKETNVVAARKFGMKGIQFESVGHLKGELQKLGVNVR